MPEFLDPNKILDQVFLQSNFVTADFGCGAGGWTIPLAQRLKEGKVYAIDLKEEAISALKSRTSLTRVNNIVPILANVEEKISELKDSYCDFILLTNILFQAENPKNIFKEISRILKTDGKVLVVEWSPDSPFGPQDNLISIDDIKKLASEINFQLEKEINTGTYHYGLLLKKENLEKDT